MHGFWSLQSESRRGYGSVFGNRREVNDRHGVFNRDVVAIDAAHQLHEIIRCAELRILFLNFPGREGVDGFDFDTIQDGGEELLPSSKSWSDRDPNDHSRLVFGRF